MYELHCWPVYRHHTVSYLGQSQSSFQINKAPKLRGSSSALIMNHIDIAGDVGDSRTSALLAMTKFEAHDEKPLKYMPEPPLCINLNDSQSPIHPSFYFFPLVCSQVVVAAGSRRPSSHRWCYTSCGDPERVLAGLGGRVIHPATPVS